MDEEKGIQELTPWLNSILLRAPHSRIIIVGTHLDEIPDNKCDDADHLLIKVGELANKYRQYCDANGGKLDIAEIIPVGLRRCIENIGQKIPASYHTLLKKLEMVQQEVRSGAVEPIMHTKQFETMVQLMDLADIQDEDELMTAVLFLIDMGSLLKYNIRDHNLHEMYFIDPCWLFDMIFKIMMIDPSVCSGILHVKDVPVIYGVTFPVNSTSSSLCSLTALRLPFLLTTGESSSRPCFPRPLLQSGLLRTTFHFTCVTHHFQYHGYPSVLLELAALQCNAFGARGLLCTGQVLPM